ncbi:MAG: hypothetical protein IJ087_10070 [Eggerthellaceae bacterium]|nr:hypothetical protein [Eggerthellaceae bacterium]
MGEGFEGRRGYLGGIASLVKTVSVYGEAIDYDLMTKAGLTLRDWERGDLDSRSLIRFVKGLGPDSSYFKAAHPESAETAAWVDGSVACALIADMIDVMRAGFTNLAYKNTGKRMPRIEPYERPWAKRRSSRYGRKPIPITNFNKWYYGGEA